MKRALSRAVGAALILSGCSADFDDPTTLPPVPTGATPGPFRTVRGEEFDGVRLFWHPGNGDQAALFGVPSIENDCLVISGVVVVWAVEDVDIARGLVEALRAGEPVGEMTLGGSGGRADGPWSEIQELCSPDQIWLAGRL